jgi:hypothetical protein
MSLPSHPKGEYRRVQHEGSPVRHARLPQEPCTMGPDTAFCP